MAVEEQSQGTASVRKRYVQLEPMDVDTETQLAVLARSFFSPMFQHKAKTPPPGQPLTPASGKEFMDFLKIEGSPFNEPDKYIYQIRELLERMATNNILVDMGHGRDGSFVMMPKCYYALSEESSLRQQGFLSLAKTLGGKFVHRQISPAIVHIVGENDNGDGSGIIFDAYHVLTCKHVVTDMKVAANQVFQGKEVMIDDIFKHQSEEVAVIRVKERLVPVLGLGFLSPMVSQKVYRFGYSRVPCSIPSGAGGLPLVMHSGEVTNQSICMFGGTELFLYSAIARPGDSGGAVVSDDGYVIGMATELSDARYKANDGEDVFSPHYAGIPADVIAKAVDDLSIGVRVPYETFE